MQYVLMTDSDSDLPFHLKAQYDIPVVSMPYALNGKEYFDDLGQSLNYKSYYDMMRGGAVPVTSALNEETYLEYFEPILKEKDLLNTFLEGRNNALLFSKSNVNPQTGKPTIVDPDTNRPRHKWVIY